jgi:transposase
VPRYSEALKAVKAGIRKRMHLPARQSLARISEETGIHIRILCAWRKGWPASQGVV